MHKENKKTEQKNTAGRLHKARKSVRLQAALAILTVALTVIVLFAATAAWYTNIVNTSNLLFETESWGFKGQVLVGNAPVEAGPGDEGIIPLTVTNDSDDMVAVSLNISKVTMSEEMKRRLYFYVETQMSRNGEIMDRVYLSSTNSYSYLMFPGGDLTLNDSVHNDAVVKWHWVYDVLGYYVLGTAYNEGSQMVVDEYLRPIEYDYDEATTTFVTDGDQQILQIATVDGVTTVEEFLVELSQKDGYEGQIDPSAKNASGYYPVDVDENGYGVWAYMCSYSDIERNTAYDTSLGQAAAAGERETYTARLTVSAQKTQLETVAVGTAAELQAALDNELVDMVTFSSNITANSTLVVNDYRQVVVDLNGYTLTSTAPATAVDVSAGSKLVMQNGQMVADTAYGLVTRGAEVTMYDVDISDANYGVYVLDNTDKSGWDSKVRMVECEIDADGIAIFMHGNGIASAQKTQVILEGCVINSGSVGIQGNGTTESANNTGSWGTDVQIIGTTVNSKWAAVFQPQKNSVTTVSGGSVLTAHTGMEIKGGTVVIIDSTIHATGEKATPVAHNSGCTDTGDAVYIEANYGHPIVLEVYGSSDLISDNGYAIQVFEEDAKNVTVTLYGGSFHMDVSRYLAEGAVMDEEYRVSMP